ncbi:MAG: glutamate dehydrogenase, partial [Myxococcota bacterium]
YRTVEAFPGGQSFESKEIITWSADALIPAALEDVITVENAAEVRASVVVEAANGPTTPEAHEILVKRGVTVVPDVLANAGGVTVSYFEWAQNVQRFSWELDRVTLELEKAMRRAYASVREIAKEKKLDLRTAAFILAIRRVGQAALSRRTTREEIKFD